MSLALLISILVMAWGLLLTKPVTAQGIAISGSFYRHHFQLVPGETISTPDIYVVIFNNGEESVNVRLISKTPPGVELLLTLSEFSIPSKGNRRIQVGVRVSTEATPGEYEISVGAEIIPEEGRGVVITSAAEQRARLSIFGEAGDVHITTVTLEGELLACEVHLYQKLEDQLSPVGYSNEGEIIIRLVPGDYMVQAFFEGTEVAKEEFSLSAYEKKEIVLTAQTVLILGFNVVPSYLEDSGEISFANITYTIKNIHQVLKEITVKLSVTIGYDLLEEVEIFSVPTLDMGNMSGIYRYIPTQGWRSTIYTFSISLYSHGRLYARSLEKELTVSKTAAPSQIDWLYIGMIAIYIIFGALLIYALYLLYRIFIQKISKRPSKREEKS